MNNQELHYLVTLCRAYLEDERIRLQENTDYDRLYTVARSHNLSAVVFCVLNRSTNRETVPTDAFKRFQEDFFEAVMRYDIQQTVYETLETALSESGIRHIFFKGVLLRELFPVPQARVMGDIDVFIQTKDNPQIKSVLAKYGFQPVHMNGPVQDYYRDDVKIEVHTKIISGRVGNAPVEEAFADAFSHGVFDGCKGEPEVSYHFAYLIAHLAHHFAFYGAGVKLILDLAVLLKRGDVDMDKVFAILQKAGLEPFAKVILSVCHKWFGYGTAYTDDTAETEAFLLSYGAFGNANRNRAAVAQRRDMEEGKRVSPLRSRWRLLFPSYARMKDIPYIRFIEGRPWLLPYAWIVRIFYNLRHKRTHVKDTAAGLGSDEAKREAEKELAYFKKIGLL